MGIQPTNHDRLMERSASSQLVVAAATMLMVVSAVASAQDREADSAASSGEALTEIIVEGRKMRFFQNDAFGATKMGLDLIDTPQTVTVITSDMMDIMNVYTLDDINRVIPGSSRTFDLFGNDNFYFRGFQGEQGNVLRVDGFRFGSEVKINPAIFDRVEIIQGATSTLYGQNNPSGTINAVSKVPQNEFSAKLDAAGGNNEYYRGGADITGPIGDSNWSYRLVGDYDHYGTHWNGLKADERVLFSPMIQYDNGNFSFLTRVIRSEREAGAFRASYFQASSPSIVDPGTDIANGDTEILPLMNVPRERLLGTPWGEQEESITTVQSQIDYRFDNGWTARGHFQHSSDTVDWIAPFVWGPIDFEGNTAIDRIQMVNSNTNSNGVEFNIFGPFTLFGREHTAFFGADYSRYKSSSSGSYNFLSTDWSTSVFNVYEPFSASGYPQTRDAAVALLRDPAGAFGLTHYAGRSGNSYLGGTLQFLFNITDRLDMLVGGRSWHDTGWSEDATSGPDLAAVNTSLLGATRVQNPAYNDFVGQIGFTYAIIDGMNFYASYGETAEPSNARIYVEGDPNGEAIGSETGVNYEVGFKGVLGQRASYRLTGFIAEKDNIAQADPVHPGYSLPVGGQVGQGVEATLQGAVTPDLTMFLAATYLDAKFKGQYEGARQSNAPEFSVTAFGVYQFSDGLLNGLGLSLGGSYKAGVVVTDLFSTTPPNADYTEIPIEDIFELDGRIFYDWNGLRFYVSATNLTSTHYVTASNNYAPLNTHNNPSFEVRAGVKVDLAYALSR